MGILSQCIPISNHRDAHFKQAYNFICQLCLNKAEKKGKKKQRKKKQRNKERMDPLPSNCDQFIDNLERPKVTASYPSLEL